MIRGALATIAGLCLMVALIALMLPALRVALWRQLRAAAVRRRPQRSILALGAGAMVALAGGLAAAPAGAECGVRAVSGHWKLSVIQDEIVVDQNGAEAETRAYVLCRMVVTGTDQYNLDAEITCQDPAVAEFVPSAPYVYSLGRVSGGRPRCSWELSDPFAIDRTYLEFAARTATVVGSGHLDLTGPPFNDNTSLSLSGVKQ